MRYIILLFRIVVGILFIISGLVKLNDPMGFAFKLEEYFSKPVLNLSFLEPFALSLAIMVCIAEILLGVMLLLGYRKKITLWLLLAMLIFFGFLTFYSAYFNKVTDCGCFGDAFKFTPWGSFFKDVFLLTLTIVLFVQQKHIQVVSKGNLPAIISLLTFVFCLFFVYYVYNHLPVKDFRAYKIGVNIPQAMTIPEGAPLPKYEMTFLYKIDGETKKLKMSDLTNLPKGAEFISREDVLIEKGYEPPIHNFFIEKDGEDFVDDFMEKEKLLLVISYRLDKSDEEAFVQIKKATDKALKMGYSVIGLTSTMQQAEAIKKTYELNFDFYFNDETTLKTMIRSNPGAMLLNKGTIIDKKHHNDLDKLNF